MSTERDELADIIATHNNTSGLGRVARRLPDNAPVYEGEQLLATLILAAGYRKPRVVTTAAELDALPTGSVVMGERIKSVWKKIEGPDRGDELTVWWQAGWEEDQDSQEIIARGPVTVLHEGAQP